MKCRFCEGEQIRDREVIRTDFVRVFPSNMPIVPGHLLVCPVRHVAKFEDLTSEEILAIQNISSRLTKALSKVFGAKGFNYAWNEEEIAGQSIPHWHLHIVPRTEGDAGIYEYEPRKFLYSPGSRATSPEIELQQVADNLRKALN